ncbi:MAG: 23S rRNA pseudouridine(955/2504/2580) synthase RluC [Cellvibrionaceae bacterium]
MSKTTPKLNPNSVSKKTNAPVPSVQLLDIDDDIAGQRIDNYLLARLKGVPKSLIYRILRKGEVRVNKGRIKPEYKLKKGDVVRVPPVRVAQKSDIVKPSDSLSQLLCDSVLYEDESVLVINKPSGLAVHGGSGVNLGLIESLRQIRSEDFLELVHRLDRGTSGCVMVAKSRRGLRHMQQQLRDGKINKVYQALVDGRWPKRRQQINMSLLKSQQTDGGRIVRVVEEGTSGAKASLTKYRVLEHYEACTLVEAKPITGRTHQIRVHSQYAGHPILGDDKYSDRNQEAFARELGLKRLFLHAFMLNFTTVDERSVQVEAPLSKELTSVLSALRE